MHEHSLALLAEETKKLLKKESTVFTPILSQRHPQAIIMSASLLHRLYGIKLVRNLCWFCMIIVSYFSVFPSCGTLLRHACLQKPFLDGAEHLTEDVVSVFPAADGLEQYIMSLIASACGEGNVEVNFRKLTPYQVK